MPLPCRPSWPLARGHRRPGPSQRGPPRPDRERWSILPRPGGGQSAAVQRQAETGAVESAAGGADAPAAGGPAGAGGNRDQDMDELARKLYGRIRERLGAELLADRERAGLLVDA